MLNRMKHVKWGLIVYFFCDTCLIIGLGAAGWTYLQASPALDTSNVWTGFLIVLILCGTFVGYVGSRLIQRKVDVLQLGIKQIASGNLAERIELTGKDGFDTLYQDFNEMAESLEERLKVLQKLGEEHALLQMQTSEAAVLEERKRLARDLHDTVSQQLFAMHMAASSLSRLLAVNPDGVNQVVGQLVSMSQHAQREMRTLIAQLRPLELEGKSLQEALEQWFPGYCGQNDLQGTLDLQLPARLSEALEHQLFLIIQEALANVVKHAKATRIALSLQDTGHQYVLTVSDNGVGFEVDAGPRKSYGLSTMRERAQRLGGEAEIRSRTGHGTSVKVNIPKFS